MKEKPEHYYPEARQMALLLDLDNFPLPSDPGEELGLVLNALNAWGKIAVRRAYGNGVANKPAVYRQLLAHRFEVTQAPQHKPGRKNGVDIHIAVEIMELLYTRPGIQTFAIATGDSDFVSLVERLHEHRRAVIGLGSRKSSSDRLVRCCDTYLYYEDIVAANRVEKQVDLLRCSTPVKSSAEEIKTLLRKKNVYPPEPELRAEILSELEGMAPELTRAPHTVWDAQAKLLDRCAAKGISKTSVRNCVRTLAYSGIIAPDRTESMFHRPVAEIPPAERMNESICRSILDLLLAEPNFIADHLAVAEAVWGDRRRRKHVESVTEAALRAGGA